MAPVKVISGCVAFKHTAVVPLMMAVGNGLIVTLKVTPALLAQPLPFVTVMVPV